MYTDRVAGAAINERLLPWLALVKKEDSLRAIGATVAKAYMGAPLALEIPVAGSFSVAFKIKFSKGAALMKIIKPGRSMFPMEKTRREVAVMQYITECTRIPVPLILASGSKDESPRGLGAYIIMEFIENDDAMDQMLSEPQLDFKHPLVPRSDFHAPDITRLYRISSEVLLQLWSTKFSRIGCLAEVDGHWDALKRPLTLNMNELVQLGQFPRSKLPQSTFSDTRSYFVALADMHFDHLVIQPNDAIQSEDDGRRKYIGRKLFQKLARQGRLSSHDLDRGPYKLWCDDLRPSNMLVGNGRLKGVIDWEFTYAAPVEFSAVPPWWLLVRRPEDWPDGLVAWANEYEARLPVFLSELRSCEDEAASTDTSLPHARLAGEMERHWRSGYFWIVYAAQRSFAFDDIYWNFIHELFYQKTDSAVQAKWQSCMKYLTAEEQEEMETLIQRKLNAAEELCWEPDEVYEEHDG